MQIDFQIGVAIKHFTGIVATIRIPSVFTTSGGLFSSVGESFDRHEKIWKKNCGDASLFLDPESRGALFPSLQTVKSYRVKNWELKSPREA